MSVTIVVYALLVVEFIIIALHPKGRPQFYAVVGMRNSNIQVRANLTVHIGGASETVAQIAVDEFLAQLGGNAWVVETVELFLAESVPITARSSGRCADIVVIFLIVEILTKAKPTLCSKYHGAQINIVISE